MKRVAVVVALAAIAGALWYLRRPGDGAASPSATEPAPQTAAAPVAKVTKLASPEQRKQLAERIASAQASRAGAARTSAAAAGPTGPAAHHAPAPPSLPREAVEPSQAETLKVEIRTAMREVIPLLTECYQDAIPELAEPETRIVAELTLTGDPDVGTLIDAKQLADATGTPLPATFDDCLRSTFQSLALPPLAEGDHFEVHYPFVFAKN